MNSKMKKTPKIKGSNKTIEKPEVSLLNEKSNEEECFISKEGCCYGGRGLVIFILPFLGAIS